MADCLHPVPAWKCGTILSQDGIVSQNLVFSRQKAVEYFSHILGSDLAAELVLDNNCVLTPCGKCAICQIRKRKDMSVRLTHEASMHEHCCFITLTYDDKHIPMTSYGKWTDKEVSERCPEILRGDVFGFATLLPSDVQKFMKRLRRHLEYKPKKKSKGIRDYCEKKIRYFCVGEYGSKTKRPHYHIMIFGWKPSDLTLLQVKKGYNVYRSSQIEKLWSFGFSTVGDVNAGVAKYCSRYVTKKFAKPSYLSEDDEIVCPEFFIQSVQNGGIGALWLERNFKSLSNGFVTARTGKDRITKFAVPRYYYNRLRKTHIEFWLKLRDERIEFVKTHPHGDIDYEKLNRLVMCYENQFRNQSQNDVF
jgi:hypothetical protein